LKREFWYLKTEFWYLKTEFWHLKMELSFEQDLVRNCRVIAFHLNILSTNQMPIFETQLARVTIIKTNLFQVLKSFESFLFLSFEFVHFFF
jgi:hypothetical protein